MSEDRGGSKTSSKILNALAEVMACRAAPGNSCNRMSGTVRSTKKIYVFLKGGLGNQMFQYAAARTLSLRTGAELRLDTWSGFVWDAQYQYHYELDPLAVQGLAASPWQRLPIWLYRTQQRLGKNVPQLIERCWYGQFLVETELAYLKEIERAVIDRDTWLVGYWQSPLYFRDYADTLRTELMPPPPQQPRYLEMGQQLRQTQSVALGIRLYEEGTNPGAHSRDGLVKSVTEIRAAIKRLRSEHPNARFYVFCTHRSPLLAQLQLPVDSVFLTGDDGYEGTMECLWLLSQCRHHIFTNSSYYWWGAWLSASVWADEKQYILAADNFVNCDGFCEQWDRF